jgi:hypothetical protein
MRCSIKKITGFTGIDFTGKGIICDCLPWSAAAFALARLLKDEDHLSHSRYPQKFLIKNLIVSVENADHNYR